MNLHCQQKSLTENLFSQQKTMTVLRKYSDPCINQIINFTSSHIGNLANKVILNLANQDTSLLETHLVTNHLHGEAKWITDWLKK